MNVSHHKPAARGVNQLMYVGDDAAIESATASGWSTPVKVALAAALAYLLLGRR